MGYQGGASGGRETAQAEYEWTEVSPAYAVIETLAEVTDRNPNNMEPLYEYVDPDAMNAFIGSTREQSGRQESSLSFSYQEYQVSVWSDGEVVVKLNGQ